MSKIIVYWYEANYRVLASAYLNAVGWKQLLLQYCNIFIFSLKNLLIEQFWVDEGNIESGGLVNSFFDDHLNFMQR